MDLQILVPRNTDLSVKHGDGTIRIKNIEGNIAAFLEDGQIRCQDVEGALALHLEDGRVAIRNIRRDANDQVKKAQKDKEISEDEEKGAYDKIQTMTNEHTEQIDRALEKKEVDVMEV